MNEMNETFEGDLGELVNFERPQAQAETVLASNNNLTTSTSTSTSMNGPTLKNKKKKAKAASPAAAKKKSFAKHDENLKEPRPKRSLTAYNFFLLQNAKSSCKQHPFDPVASPASRMVKLVSLKWPGSSAPSGRTLIPKTDSFMKV